MPKSTIRTSVDHIMTDIDMGFRYVQTTGCLVRDFAKYLPPKLMLHNLAKSLPPALLLHEFASPRTRWPSMPLALPIKP